MIRLVMLLPLLFAACSESGPEMAPGENCMTCHTGHERAFTIAGTMFSKLDDPTTAGVEGVQIKITDGANKIINLTSNAVGNFYYSQPVTYPLAVEVTRNGKTTRMMQAVPTGACSSCHNQPPTSNAPGRNYAP